MKGYSRTMVLW